MAMNYSIEDCLATGADILVDAFDGALKKLVVDRRDPEALVVAKHLISIAKAGERDPVRLRDLTVRAVRVERRRLRAAIPGHILRSLITGFWATHLL
jgi:NADPH-dependent ferric siderophore reductase